MSNHHYNARQISQITMDTIKLGIDGSVQRILVATYPTISRAQQAFSQLYNNPSIGYISDNKDTLTAESASLLGYKFCRSNYDIILKKDTKDEKNIKTECPTQVAASTVFWPSFNVMRVKQALEKGQDEIFLYTCPTIHAAATTLKNIANGIVTYLASSQYEPSLSVREILKKGYQFIETGHDITVVKVDTTNSGQTSRKLCPVTTGATLCELCESHVIQSLRLQLESLGLRYIQLSKSTITTITQLEELKALMLTIAKELDHELMK